MKLFEIVLSNLIRSGKVTVETPSLDMDELSDATTHYFEAVVDEIERILYANGKTDAKKIAEIQKLVEEVERDGPSAEFFMK